MVHGIFYLCYSVLGLISSAVNRKSLSDLKRDMVLNLTDTTLARNEYITFILLDCTWKMNWEMCYYGCGLGYVLIIALIFGINDSV